MTNPYSTDVELDEIKRRSLPRRILNRLEVDRATFYGIATRYWKLVAGPVTALLIVKFFSEDVQGFFYAFSSVIVLQTFFELAFPTAIITHASHQWAKLEFGDDGGIIGDLDAKSRLIDLMQTSVKVFVWLAIGFGVFAACFGIWLFSDDPAAAFVQWKTPWLALVVLSTITFALVPFLAVLEGCDQVREVFKLQLAREVLGNFVVWGTMILGCNLWVPVFAMAVRLACEVLWLAWRYGVFFRELWHKPTAARLNWRQEVWPFQSRLILRGLLSYFNADVMQLVVFRLQGAAVGGQFGLTWTVVSAIRAACSAWLRSRQPRLGALVAQKNYAEMDRVFFRVSGIALGIMLIASVGFTATVMFLPWLGLGIETRLLSIWPTVLLGVGSWAALAMEFQWVYLHAHGKSPFLKLSMLGNILSGALIIGLGYRFGALGVAAAFAIMHMLVFLPMSSWGFVYLRQRWHGAEASP